MRPMEPTSAPYQAPTLTEKALKLTAYTKTLSAKQLEASMQLSKAMAIKTHDMLQAWNTDPATARPAIDSFLGDIYSGLQVQSLSQADREYANAHLYILSGLYGVLRALDSIHPYRLEMGYKLPDDPYKNLYRYWGDTIALRLPKDQPIINVSAVEYTKAVLPYLPNTPVITPKFLTASPKTGVPTFVTVHTKIARGAFARWLIVNRVQELSELRTFSDLGYKYDAEASTDTAPVYTCKSFQGLGLSVRLS